MRGYDRVFVTLIIVFCLFISACGGSGKGVTLPDSIQETGNQPVTEQPTEQPTSQGIPDVAALPHTTSALGEYIDLANPLIASDNYHYDSIQEQGYLRVDAENPMCFATFCASGYGDENTPDLLRIYELSTQIDNVWIGFADFERGAWRWQELQRIQWSQETLNPQDLAYAPDNGQFYRDDDGAAFITIVVTAPEDIEGYINLSFQSARLASGHGLFYEHDFFVKTESDLAQLKGYSFIGGNLSIDCYELDDLDDLSSMIMVGGGLLVVDLRQRHMAGLENLDTIVADTWFTDNSSFTDDPIEPFELELPSLKRSGSLLLPGYIKVDLPELVSCDRIDIECSPLTTSISIPKIESISNSINIRGKSQDLPSSQVLTIDFESLHDVSNLVIDSVNITSIDISDLIYVDNLTFNNIPNINNLNFTKLNVSDSLRVHDLPNLDLLRLKTSDLIELISIKNLPNLNNSRISIHPESGIEAGDMESVQVIGCDQLTDLSFLSGTLSSGHIAKLEVSDCSSLTNLEGLEWVQSIEKMKLSYLPSLNDASALDGATITDELYIQETGLSSLPLLADMSQNTLSSVDLRNNSALASIAGLSGLTYIGSGLAIVNNDTLVDLTGLDNLQTSGNVVYIDGNQSLTNLDALSNLRQIRTDNSWDFPAAVIITENLSLNSVAGLSGLLPDPGTGYVLNQCQITNNALTGGDQDAWDLVDAWGGPSVVSDNIIISNN